jgi:hypothetical protein
MKAMWWLYPHNTGSAKGSKHVLSNKVSVDGLILYGDISQYDMNHIYGLFCIVLCGQEHQL